MATFPQYATASELRYVLDVMEERAHLGLDNESATKIREVLGRKIAKREDASVRKSVTPVAVAEEKSELLVS